jgi:hypothetical protein
MGTILVGTASWTDKTLIESGRFYPPDAKTAEARLRHYAAHFPLVEVDSSYYALPARRTAEAWAERTPDGFAFDVKAFRLFTGHGASPSALPKDLRAALPETDGKAIYYRDLPEEIRRELWQRFRAGLEPLVDAGKLRAVLLQLAPWLVANRDRSSESCAPRSPRRGIFFQHFAPSYALQRRRGPCQPPMRRTSLEASWKAPSKTARWSSQSTSAQSGTGLRRARGGSPRQARTRPASPSA